MTETQKKDVEVGNNEYSGYTSLSKNIRQVHVEAKNPLEFSEKLFSLCCNSVVLIILLCGVLLWPIGMIVIGALFENDCPAQKMIPLWLIVSGSVSVASSFISMATKSWELKQKRRNPMYRLNAIFRLKYLLDIFVLAWFIAGNVWVFEIYTTIGYDKNNAVYCNGTCYLYAFWSIITTYIITGCVCLCCCFACCIKAVAG